MALSTPIANETGPLRTCYQSHRAGAYVSPRVSVRPWFRWQAALSCGREGTPLLVRLVVLVGLMVAALAAAPEDSKSPPLPFLMRTDDSEGWHITDEHQVYWTLENFDDYRRIPSDSQAGDLIYFKNLLCTGRMEPLIGCTDRLVTTDQFSSEHIVIGSVIGVQGVEGYFTHRVVRIFDLGDEAGLHYQTQGDASGHPDLWLVPYGAIDYLVLWVMRDAWPENAWLRGMVNKHRSAHIEGKGDWECWYGVAKEQYRPGNLPYNNCDREVR